MAITYTTYYRGFPFTEKYEKWLITYNNANTFFYKGDGFQKIKADIKPDLIELLSFLSQNNIVSGINYERTFMGTISGIKYSSFNAPIIEATIYFCENCLHYSITKKGHDFIFNRHYIASIPIMDYGDQNPITSMFLKLHFQYMSLILSR